MKAIDLTQVRQLNHPQFWLLATGAGLAAIHLTLIERLALPNQFGTSLLFWAAVFSLTWHKRDRLRLESDPCSSIAGICILAVVLLRSASLTSYDSFLRISPCLSLMGVGLLASGIRGCKQYWQELVALCLLALPTGAISSLLDISPLTAKFAALVLWYAGFDVNRQGVYLYLPTGSVEVYPGCSGMESIMQLVGMAAIFLLMFPMSWGKRLLIPAVAIGIAFVVNGIRVALMAFLIAYSSSEAFEYWHTGDGSLIFSMIAVFFLGTFCLFLLRQSPADQNVEEDAAG
jgi:cyanoexosortase A